MLPERGPLVLAIQVAEQFPLEEPEMLTVPEHSKGCQQKNRKCLALILEHFKGLPIEEEEMLIYMYSNPSRAL